MGFGRPFLIALLGFLAAAPAGAVDRPNLFGTAETRSENLRPFSKWTTVVDRYRAEQSLEAAPCAQLGALKCRLADWRRFLSTLEGKPRHEQILAVNAHMNRRSYIEDLPNYGVPDYWATPREFLTRDGDCEDYAIAKFMSLRALGFQPDELRLVVLQDLNLNVAHAVLVVYHDGKALLLDNQIKQVVETQQARHYRPLYSINERSWWLHKPMQVSRATP
jgi:predicted transglutaminase-like cysteine proteinase